MDGASVISLYFFCYELNFQSIKNYRLGIVESINQTEYPHPYNPPLITNHFWIVTLHEGKMFKKNVFLNKEMVFKKWVEKKIKTVGYNGASTVELSLNILPGNCKTSLRKRSEHFRGSTWYSTLFSGCHCHNTLIICWCKSGVFAPQKCTPWLDFLFWHFFSYNGPTWKVQWMKKKTYSKVRSF